MKILFVIIFWRSEQKEPSPGGLEPPSLRLTAERANQLRHGDLHEPTIFIIFNCVVPIFHLRKISATFSHLTRKKWQAKDQGSWILIVLAHDATAQSN